jgi:AcrR family transcriptional regulator
MNKISKNLRAPSKGQRAVIEPAITKLKRKRKPRITLSAINWISEAEELLVSKSIDSVRVDTLAKKLKVTRGSFYWHFDGRPDLLRRLLLSWKERQTEDIIRRYQTRRVQSKELIAELLALPAHGRAATRGASVELAIRAWARREPAVRAVVDDVDAQRFGYIEHCFTSLGCSVAQSKARAFILYGYMQAESILSSLGTPDEKSARREFIASALLPSGD